jgi:hypothetical protein
VLRGVLAVRRSGSAMKRNEEIGLFTKSSIIRQIHSGRLLIYSLPVVTKSSPGRYRLEKSAWSGWMNNKKQGRFGMRFSKWTKMLFTMSVVSLCVVSIAFAGDQDRKRDRKKDKSCQGSYIQDEKNGLDLAAIKKRDRKKDGSCQTTISEEEAGFDLAALKKRDRTRDRKKDGSCQSSITGEKAGIELAADKIRDRKKDGTCKSKDTLPLSA